jgi:hypothetical protein
MRRGNASSGLVRRINARGQKLLYPGRYVAFSQQQYDAKTTKTNLLALIPQLIPACEIQQSCSDLVKIPDDTR